MNASRRNVLKWMGISLALPAVPAFAQGMATRKRFIGVYVPNGAHMPMGADGTWTFAEALQPLVAAGHQGNTMIMRKLYNGFPGHDPHWQNCAGFLSCEPMVLGNPGIARCGKTLDQFVADRYPSSLRSLEIGGIYYHVHPLNDHPGYSNDYLNRISWQEADKFRSPIPNPAQLFVKLFGGEEGSAAQIAWLQQRKRSVLDTLHKDATRMSNRLPASYRGTLSAYMDTVREVEMGLSQGGFTCTPNLAQPTQDFSNPNGNYVLRFQLMHQLVVLAMQCNLTNVATLMYGPGVSEQMNYPESLGGGAGHHAVAHHGGTGSSIDRLKAINRVQSTLLADLITKLKAASLINETLVLYGSDMSDGNVHYTENLPVVLCGAGSDLKFGQEIVPAARRPLADLHVDIARELGLSSITSFGSGAAASSGQSLGIRV